MEINTNNKIYTVDFGTETENLGALAKRIVLAAASSAFKCDSSELHFEKGAHGKPFLREFPDFHFNISHTKTALAVAFGDSPLGVDIEKLRDISLKPARRFCENEQKYIKNEKDFFYIWTRKEAYIKRSGEGLSRPLNSFNCLEKSEIKTFSKGEFIISVCSDTADCFEIIELTPAQILEN